MKIKKLVEKFNDFFEFSKKKKKKKLEEIIEKLTLKKTKIKKKLKNDHLIEEKKEILENELEVVTNLIKKAKKEI